MPMPLLPTSVYGDGAEGEASYWPPLHASARDKTDISEANILPMLLRKLATPRPPSIRGDIVLPPLIMISKDIAWDKVKEAKQAAKNNIENEANGIMRQITYPEGLIKEAVNRHLSKNPKLGTR